MTSVTNGEPVRVEQLFRDLVDALKRLQDLRTLVCEAEAPPDNYSQLAKELHETVGEIRVLQRQLLSAKLTNEQQNEIRKLFAGEGSLKDA